MNKIRLDKMWMIYIENKSFVDESIKKMIERYHVLAGTVMSIPVYNYNNNRYDNTIAFRVTYIEGRNYYMALV